MQLVADNLLVERGGRIVVDGVSFTIRSGEAMLLTGPNGAGKTSLIRAVAGFLPLAGGSVRLDGGAGSKVSGEADREIAEQCHFVGHRDGIKGALSVRENAEFLATFLGGQVDATNSVLERLGLDGLADVPAAWLSAGQRRRLGLSRLLLAPRALWLLDEPTVSLDASAVETLAGIIGEHVAAGGIVLAATHLPLGLNNARELRLGARGVGGAGAVV